MMSRGIGEKIVNSERKQGISIVWDGDGNHIPAEQIKEKNEDEVRLQPMLRSVILNNEACCLTKKSISRLCHRNCAVLP